MKKVLSTVALATAMVLAVAGTQAAPETFNATLTGPAEEPPNTSPGTGVSIIEIDETAMTMQMRITFNNLIGTTTASHIHCCTGTPMSGTAGVATMLPNFTDFPLGVTSGLYERSFDISDPAFYNPAFLSANGGTAASAAAALIGGIEANQAYVNIHTNQYPGGEIRGFLVSGIPEPGSWAMLGIGLAGIAFCYRRRA